MALITSEWQGEISGSSPRPYQTHEIAKRLLPASRTLFLTANGLIAETPSRIRVKRQEDASNKKEESFETELCKDKDAGEWFRLVAGEGDNCRDVIQCTSSVSQVRGSFFGQNYP